MKNIESMQTLLHCPNDSFREFWIEQCNELKNLDFKEEIIEIKLCVSLSNMSIAGDQRLKNNLDLILADVYKYLAKKIKQKQANLKEIITFEKIVNYQNNLYDKFSLNLNFLEEIIPYFIEFIYSSEPSKVDYFKYLDQLDNEFLKTINKFHEFDLEKYKYYNNSSVEEVDTDDDSLKVIKSK